MSRLNVQIKMQRTLAISWWYTLMYLSAQQFYALIQSPFTIFCLGKWHMQTGTFNFLQEKYRQSYAATVHAFHKSMAMLHVYPDVKKYNVVI